MSYSIGEWVGKNKSAYSVGKCLPILNVTPLKPSSMWAGHIPGIAVSCIITSYGQILFDAQQKEKNPKEQWHV